MRPGFGENHPHTRRSTIVIVLPAFSVLGYRGATTHRPEPKRVLLLLSDVTCPEIFRETSRQAGARLASNAIAFNTGAEYVIVAAATRAGIAGTAFDIVKARNGL